ncbi:hypothetical protein DYB36_011337 [Aphanomyces astaci]|uniref:Uncharacterized protein n=1 Tax=Aphanomyces astaci TaxID=112090 RepID=A0A397B5U5_APHAT|nr:hypothetical protein DYB36_011337 [Aphanomyces astaci]
MSERTIWKDARHGKVLEVQRRLAQGEFVDQVDEELKSPLSAAASEGRADVLHLLLAKESSTTDDGKTPVDLAVEHNHANCKVLLLLRQQHPLLYYAKAGDLAKLMVQVAHCGAPDERDESKKTALMYAAVSGHTHIVRYLLTLNVDMHAADMHGTTLLMTAVDSGEADIVKLLLDQNADLNAQRGDGKTPLEIAAEGNHVGSRAFLEKEALFRDKFPLLYQARSDNVDATRQLLEAGAPVDERDDVTYISTLILENLHWGLYRSMYL